MSRKVDGDDVGAAGRWVQDHVQKTKLRCLLGLLVHSQDPKAQPPPRLPGGSCCRALPPTPPLARVLQRRWECSSGLVSLMEVTVLPSVQASLMSQEETP